MADSIDNSKRILKKRHERDIRKRLFLIPKLFAVFALVFLLITFFFRGGSSVQTCTALNGSIEEYVLADGYVFRQQTLVTSPADGYFQSVVKEGRRVNENSTLAAVYKNEVDPAVTEELSDINSKLESLNSDLSTSDIFSGSDVKIELSIAEQIRELTKVRDNNEFDDTDTYKSAADELITAKQEALEGGKSKEERISELEVRKQELENSGAYECEYIYAPTSGVYSSRIDGYEDALSIDMLGDATPKYLSDIEKSDVSLEETVKSGENVCKIINNYDWYFVGTVTEKEASGFEVGKDINMRFYDLSDNVVSGTITAISKAESGKVAVTVHSTKYIDSIYMTNKASAELLTESAEGIKVPSGSLRVIDGQQGVYVVRLGVARYVPVNVLYKNDEWAIVEMAGESSESGLKIYDEVIVNTKGIEDGKIVRQ